MPTQQHGPARPDAADAGRAAQVANQVQQDLLRQVGAYPALFASPAMQPVPEVLAQAWSFGTPGYAADEVRAGARVSLWIFGLDWLVDHQATTADQVDAIVGRCMGVADALPTEAGDELAGFLAGLRADLAAAPAFAELAPVWREELRRMLHAMATEWAWKVQLGMAPAARRAGPPGIPAAAGMPASPPATLEGYLAIADNFGSVLTHVTHWMANSDPSVLTHLEELRTASRLAQAAMRLANDLATTGREREWGDLNAIALGISAHDIGVRIGELAGQARQMLEPLRARCPRGATLVLQQMDWTLGFYGGGRDFWAMPVQ